MKALAALGLVLVLVAVMFSTCGSATEEMTVTVTIDPAFVEDLKTVQRARVFFGHHSVGGNLLEGLAVLGKEAGVEVRIEDAPVGANKQPLSKFEDFARRGERSPDDGTQLMLMKLCYVDFDPDTDVAALATAYQAAVARVRKARPGVKILHVTPPLGTRPTDWKSKINRLLGRLVWEDRSALKRMQFAERLHQAFPGESFFELAAVESTRPDGTEVRETVDGKPVPFLWPGYTSDGGHLNDPGKRVGAKAFVQALAAALRK